ncbi:hypothetical protein A3Q56_00096, partial [Intoshia linei]
MNDSKRKMYMSDLRQYVYMERIRNLNKEKEVCNVEGDPQSNGVTLYKLTPMWRRCFAEIIDTLLLFIFQVILLTRISTYRNFVTIMVGFYENMFEMQEIIFFIIMGLMYRMIMTFLEAYLLSYHNGITPGQTIGKYLMKCRLISCRNIATIRSTRYHDVKYIIEPAQILGYI